MFTQSIKFYTFHYQVLKSNDVWNVIHQIGSKKWMVASFSKCYGKIWVVFYLNTGEPFFSVVSFYSQQKKRRLFWKMVLGIFKIVLCLRDWHIFMWQSAEIFERFQCFNSETDFLKNKNFFKKVEYHFLVESTKHHFHTKLSYQRPMLSKKNGEYKMDLS